MEQQGRHLPLRYVFKKCCTQADYAVVFSLATRASREMHPRGRDRINRAVWTSDLRRPITQQIILEPHHADAWN
jgi:hypothetical protein